MFCGLVKSALVERCNCFGDVLLFFNGRCNGVSCGFGEVTVTSIFK